MSAHWAHGTITFSFTGVARSGLASAPVISGGMHID